MFCGECGTQNPDTNQFCKNCGKPLRKPQQAPAPQPAAVTVPPVAAQPVYNPPLAAGVQPPGVIAGAPVKPPLNKGMLALCIIGVALGIASWFRYPYLLGILTIVLGGIAVAKSENKKSKTAIAGILAIIIGLASIIVNLFYFSFFPPVPVL